MGEPGHSDSCFLFLIVFFAPSSHATFTFAFWLGASRAFSPLPGCHRALRPGQIGLKGATRARVEQGCAAAQVGV
ncbi:hypothetical protein L209DRAFT_758773 [Thermothelomyces heterothallicus CBS 203.75]